MYACENNFYNIAKILINKSKNLINTKDNYGWTPLMYCCFYGCFEIIQFLLNQSNLSNLNDKNNDNQTAFMLAYRYCKVKIAKELLKQKKIDYYVEKDEKRFILNDILETYKKDPYQVRYKLLLESNLDIFYHIIFASDDYYQIINNNKNTRFMKILVKLPNEIQMMIIHIMSGSKECVIPTKLFNSQLPKYVKKYITDWS
jgi:ankyrin repeat protein